MSFITDLFSKVSPSPQATAAASPTLWKVSDGSFKGFIFHVAVATKAANFGMMSQEIKTERRLQISEKPGLDGAEVEDFGRKPRVFTAEVIFFTNDYLDNLTAFEAVLNQGTSGTLILPDIKEAVHAKFQSESRRTNTETCTILQLTFIEDNIVAPVASNAVTQSSAIAALAKNNPTAAIPTIFSKGNQIITAANSLSELLNNNPILTAIQLANNAVVNVTSTINSVLNIPRTLRQTIIGVIKETQDNIANLVSAVNGVMNFSSLLTLPPLTTTNPQSVNGLGNQTNTGLDSVDFQAVVAPTTSTVNGVDQVSTAKTTTTQISSLSDGQKQLETLLVALQTNRQQLETDTSGSTADYTAQSINVENFVIDLIALIAPPPNITVFSNITCSLMEICAQHGLTPNDINTVYIQNTQLEDILAIPPFTMIKIPDFVVLNQ